MDQSDTTGSLSDSSTDDAPRFNNDPDSDQEDTTGKNDPGSGNPTASNETIIYSNTKTKTDGTEEGNKQESEDRDRDAINSFSNNQDGFCAHQSESSLEGDVDNKSKEEMEQKAHNYKGESVAGVPFLDHDDNDGHVGQGSKVMRQVSDIGADGIGTQKQPQVNQSGTDDSVPTNDNHDTSVKQKTVFAEKVKIELLCQENTENCKITKYIKNCNSGSHENLVTEKDDSNGTIGVGNELQSPQIKNNSNVTVFSEDQSGTSITRKCSFSETSEESEQPFELDKFKSNESLPTKGNCTSINKEAMVNERDGATGEDLERKTHTFKKNAVETDAATDLDNKETLGTEGDPIPESSKGDSRESASDEDCDDLLQFSVIINGNHTICAKDEEEALKWRFVFDCPQVFKILKEDLLLHKAALKYKKGENPVICINKFDQKLKKEFQALLKSHADTVQIHRAVVPEVGAKMVLINLTELFKNEMVIAYKGKTTLYICGMKEYMEKAIQQVKTTMDYVLSQFLKTYTIAVNDIPIQLMRKWMKAYMPADNINLKPVLDEGTKTLAITGLEKVVKREKEQIEQLLKSITEERYESVKCASHLSFFEELEVVKDIEEILEKQNILCTWETQKNDCCIVVTAFDKETCAKAVKMIDTACVLDSITLKIDDSARIIPSASWQEHADSICTMLGGKVKLWLDQGNEKLEYVYTQSIKDEVKHEVQGLIDQWDREKYLPIEKHVFEQLVKEEKKLRQLKEKYSVAIVVSRNIKMTGFMVSGKDSNIHFALEELKRECNMILKPNIKAAETWRSFENVAVICVPESNEVELIMLSDKSLLSNESNQAELKDRETGFEIIEIIPKFPLKINWSETVKADMVLPADISKRPVTFSCPDWNDGKSKDKNVFSCVLCHLFEFIGSLGGEALLEIKDKKIGKWSVGTFVEWLLTAYQKHSKVKKRTAMSRLFLLMKDEEVYGIVKNAVCDVYSINSGTRADDKTESPMFKASQIISSRKAIEVFVVKGQLTSRQEDVLVNTAHHELKLKYGNVSKSILEAAGPEIQAECKQRYPSGIKPGHVAITKAYKLKNKFIFHGTFSVWNQTFENELKSTLKEFVIQCLHKADELKMKSIAFPAIGTGILNYPHVIVADCMFGAVEDYTQRMPAFLESVSFVIYNKDTITLSAFDERMILHDQWIAGSSVDSESTSPFGAVKQTRKLAPPILEKENKHSGSYEEGKVLVIDDEITAAQCLAKSEVRVRREVIEKIKEQMFLDVQNLFKVNIDFNNRSIQGELEDLQKLEGYLQNQLGGYSHDKSLPDVDKMEEEEEGEEEQQSYAMFFKPTMDDVSEIKYEMFRFFFDDLYVSLLQAVDIQHCKEERQLCVQGESQEYVERAVSNITKSFVEMTSFQETILNISGDQFEHAQELLVKIKSNSAQKVFCFITELDIFTIHFIAKTLDEADCAKHNVKLSLGETKISGHKKKSSSSLKDKNQDKKEASVSVQRSLPDNKRLFTTAEGIRVFVYKCSILQAEVNVIVNAANEDLIHTAGVAKVIADEAGRNFTEESQRYIKDYGNLSVGASCVTSGGNLKYPFVIHTVGPQWAKYSRTSEGVQNCMNDLWKAVIGCFFKAEGLQVESIALPAVSSGIYGVPMEVCAYQYLQAVLKYSKSVKRVKTLKEIHFIDKNDNILDLIRLAFSASLENNQKAAKEFEKKLRIYGVPSLREPKSKRKSTLKSFLNRSDQISDSFEQHYVLEKKSRFYFNKILEVLIYTDDITESICQAIVSSEDKELKSQGGVAKAIHSKAGQEYGTCLANSRGKLRKVGDAVEIQSSKLKCEKVICCIVPRWTAKMSEEQYKTQLRKCFICIMEKAKVYTSVAMPLIGTGFKDASIELCGRILLDCLLQFSRTQRDNEAIREIHIVNLDDGPTVCVKSIFMEHFDAEKKRLDAKNRKVGHVAVDSTTVSREQDSPPHNPSFQRSSSSKKVRQLSRSGEHNEAKGDVDIVTTEYMAPVKTASIQPPEVQKMDRGGGDKQVKCVICKDTFKTPVKMMKCGHVFCKGCIDAQFQQKPVCPTCGMIYGIITGNQPKGKMAFKVNKYSHLEGFQGHGMIEITYTMPNGNQSNEHPQPGEHYYGLCLKAYLPNSEKGQKVHHLLNLAFNRRLIFTITQRREGYQVTLNNVHLKTSRDGGPQSSGYPDPTYLDRVLEELAAKGVTEESEHQDPVTFIAYERIG